MDDFLKVSSVFINGKELVPVIIDMEHGRRPDMVTRKTLDLYRRQEYVVRMHEETGFTLVYKEE